MDKKEIIRFFDALAPVWDVDNVHNDEIIDVILNKAGIKNGTRVLDVACGTGVLFPDYLKRGATVCGIDISPKMVKIAKEKFPEVQVFCGDAESFPFDEIFDAVVIYNAFPHFTNQKALIEAMAKILVDGGRLSVAHGISREELQKCHSKKAGKVSKPLPEACELAELFSEIFKTDIIISDEKMYMVSGVKKARTA